MLNSLKDIHPSWEPFFLNREEELSEIMKKVGSNFTPTKERVFRFAQTNLSEVKCVWIGKDPYPQRGVATGRSFEVSQVDSWDDPAVNRSLQNIIKLLHKAYFGLERSLLIKEVRDDIRTGSFPILPPNQIFEYWEQNGVLFLNSALTCEVGRIGSHLKIWEPFFNDLLAYIVINNPRVIYFLWGDAVKYKERLLNLGVSEPFLYTSYHPSSFYGDKGGYEYDAKFLNNPCFRDTAAQIQWV